MNLLLLKSDNLTGNQARISGRQLQQLVNVQRCAVGDSIRVGEINGAMGRATILELNESQALLEVDLDSPAPPLTPLTLILAMPRPKMLRRSLQTIAAMGVKQIYLINS